MVALPFNKKPEQSRERLPLPEISKESFPAPEKNIEPQKPSVEKHIAAPAINQSFQTKAVKISKGESLQKIEQILEENMEETYHQLSPEIQKKFKQEGEKAANAIDFLLSQTKVKTGKIFKVILNWLKIIPGISKFFLRQEAKIKTDQILKLKK
jgi:hypothetical protein